jgi:hypothetical protein
MLLASWAQIAYDIDVYGNRARAFRYLIRVGFIEEPYVIRMPSVCCRYHSSFRPGRVPLLPA